MASERQEPVASRSVDVVMLGDALGKDDALHSVLPKLAAIVSTDASGIGGWETTAFLRRVFSSNYERVKATATWVIERFTQAESKRIVAVSQARVNNAQANKINAEATAIRAQERRRDQLLEYFTARSIDMAAEEQEGILRVVFMKPDVARHDRP